jgi:hypothetical protein
VIQNNTTDLVELNEEDIELEDDILSTYDFYFNNYTKINFTPEKELAQSILTTGIIDYLSNDKNKKEMYEDAKEWLFNETDSDYVFSFSNVCFLVGLNQQKLRERLKKYKKSKIKFILDGTRINRD